MATGDAQDYDEGGKREGSDGGSGGGSECDEVEGSQGVGIRVDKLVEATGISILTTNRKSLTSCCCRYTYFRYVLQRPSR